MTDKELFEKTEKVFKLKKENNLLEKVYNDGKFKTMYENTSPIRSNVGDNTVSAARAAGRGLGAVASGIGKLGQYLPFSTRKRMKKAEARKAEAQARGEELKNRQMIGKIADGGDDKKIDKPEMDEALKIVYAEPEFKRVYDKSLSGEELTANDQRIYDAGLKKADQLRSAPIEKEKEIEKEIQSVIDDFTKQIYVNDPLFKSVYDKVAQKQKLSPEELNIYNVGMKKAAALRTGQAEKTGKGEAQKEIENKAGENRLKKLGKSAPNITKFLINPKNKATKDLFTRYTLQSPALGIPTESETAQLAQNLTKTLQNNVTEINNFKKFIRNEPNLQDDGVGLIKLLPSAPTKATKTKGTTKKITLKPENVDQFIKRDAKKKNRSETAQKEEMVRQAKKYKVGNVVKGPSGGQFQIADINNETGLITVRSVNDNRRSFKFAYGLGDITEKGAEQDDLPFDSNEESFEQIVKRYR